MTLKKLHRYLFLILVLLLPTQLAFHFWPESAFVFGIRVDYLSPTVYLTDILLAALLLTWAWDEWARGRMGEFVGWLRKARLSIYLSIYLVVNVFFVAQNQPAALYKLVRLVELFFLGLYVARTRFTIHDSRFTRALSLAVIYTSFIGITQFLTGKTLGLWLLGERTFATATPGIALQSIVGQEYLRAYSTFSHPNSFAGFLLVCGVLLLPWKNILTRVAVVLGIVAFILAFSQSAWVAAVLLAGLLTARKLRAVLVRPYTIGILVLVAFLTVSVFWWNTFLPQTQEVVLRQGLAEVSLKMSIQKPFFGVGLNNFIVQLPNYSSTPQVSWWLQPVHNIFLLVLAETGLIGFGFLIWGLWVLLKKTEDRKQKTEKLETGNPDHTFGVAKPEIAFLAILLTGSLDHYWWTLQQNQLLASIILGAIFHKGR